jgi:hypothetical protein
MLTEFLYYRTLYHVNYMRDFLKVHYKGILLVICRFLVSLLFFFFFLPKVCRSRKMETQRVLGIDLWGMLHVLPSGYSFIWQLKSLSDFGWVNLYISHQRWFSLISTWEYCTCSISLDLWIHGCNSSWKGGKENQEKWKTKNKR